MRNNRSEDMILSLLLALRVVRSHFSGVATIRRADCASERRTFVSLVISRTLQWIFDSLCDQSRKRSEQSALVGAR